MATGGSMRSRFLPALLAGALLGSCGGKPLPPYLANSTQEAPRFPRRSFLTAVGVSAHSFDDAVGQARRQISEQISLQLQSEMTSYQTATAGAGRSSEAQRITQTVQTKTSFDRADLVQLVERQESDGSYYVLGVLDRAQTDGELQRAQQQDLVSFAAFVEQAAQARRESRQGDYASARSRALKLLAPLDQAFIVRRAVLGHPAHDEAAFLEKRNGLLKDIADRETRTVVQVRLDGTDSSQLLKYAVSAVRKLGLRVAEQKTCADVGGAEPAYVTDLAVHAEESCGEGSLGERCELTLRLHAKGCAGGGEGEGRTPTVKGVHPSERARARSAAWGKLTPEMVEAAVGDALRGAQVVD
jgi:LPP20 lipoprotein